VLDGLMAMAGVDFPHGITEDGTVVITVVIMLIITIIIISQHIHTPILDVIPEVLILMYPAVEMTLLQEQEVTLHIPEELEI
tara:strand:+ start:79 stop:324 length:246 start_codon:yes stop_codon:yes gene_type:complete